MWIDSREFLMSPSISHPASPTESSSVCQKKKKKKRRSADGKVLSAKLFPLRHEEK